MKTKNRKQLLGEYAAALDTLRDYVGATMQGANDGALHGTYWSAVVAAERAIRDSITESERRAAWPNDPFKVATRSV